MCFSGNIKRKTEEREVVLRGLFYGAEEEFGAGAVSHPHTYRCLAGCLKVCVLLCVSHLKLLSQNQNFGFDSKP